MVRATKYLYNAPKPMRAGQKPRRRDMKGPAAGGFQRLAELYEMSRQQSPVFRHYAFAARWKAAVSFNSADGQQWSDLLG